MDSPGGRGQEADRAIAEGEHRGQALPERVEALTGIEAEDGPQDDLHRQALHAGPELDRLAARPARDLPPGHLRDQVAEALHLLPVEGGKHQLALLQVRALVQQDDRVGSDDRLEHLRPLAGVKNVRRRREDLLDLLRVGDHHEGRRQRQANRESLAVPGSAALQEGKRARPEADALDPGGI